MCWMSWRTCLCLVILYCCCHSREGGNPSFCYLNNTSCGSTGFFTCRRIYVSTVSPELLHQLPRPRPSEQETKAHRTGIENIALPRLPQPLRIPVEEEIPAALLWSVPPRFSPARSSFGRLLAGTGSRLLLRNCKLAFAPAHQGRSKQKLGF